MATRGRKPAAALAIPPGAVAVHVSDRLAPPLHLSDAEISVWAELVSDQPAESFRVTHAPLLELYCRHIVQARLLGDQLMNFESAKLETDEGLKRYDRLLAMAERESRAASSLATRLRITRQATEHPVTVGRGLANTAKARKPWESQNDDD